MNQEVREKINKHFENGPKRLFSKGEILTHAGNDPEGVSLLIDGIVEQYDSTAEGTRVTVNVFKPGAFFPMSWAMNKTPNTYFFIALTDVTLRRASAESTVAFIRSNPDVMFDLLGRVYKGTDAILKRMIVATTGIAGSRLVFELLIEAYRFGHELPNGTVRIRVTQQALAERSGLARETVSRELHKLVQGGTVVAVRPGLALDVQQLEALLAIEM